MNEISNRIYPFWCLLTSGPILMQGSVRTLKRTQDRRHCSLYNTNVLLKTHQEFSSVCSTIANKTYKDKIRELDFGLIKKLPKYFFCTCTCTHTHAHTKTLWKVVIRLLVDRTKRVLTGLLAAVTSEDRRFRGVGEACVLEPACLRPSHGSHNNNRRGGPPSTLMPYSTRVNNWKRTGALVTFAPPPHTSIALKTQTELLGLGPCFS